MRKPKKLRESLNSLTRREKQLLCLVKSLLNLAELKLLIIEHPNLENLPVLNTFVRHKFQFKTVVFIGVNHRQFEVCNRIIQL
jgi:hypothetical protein